MPAPGSDTTPAAAAAQAQILRELPANRRLDLAIEMSVAARALLAARLRTEHPDWSDARIQRECLRLETGETPLHTPRE